MIDQPPVPVLRTLAEKARPDHTALLVVDMVNDLVRSDGKVATVAKRPMDHVNEVLPNIGRLLHMARRAGAFVVHIQHTTYPNMVGVSGPWFDARVHATYGMLDFCIDGTWGQQVIDELNPLPGEASIKKCRYSGFVGTNLDLVLRSWRIQTVIVCGVSTNVCVEATARDAFHHEYYVVWPSDASASWSRPLHQASLESAGHRYATVCTNDDLAEIWEAQ